MAQFKLEIRSWDSYCGDGCCYDWGEELFINDVMVHSGSDVDVDSVISALEFAGHTVEFVGYREHECYDSRMDWEDDWEGIEDEDTEGEDE